MSLEEYIKSEIHLRGPMDIGAFMGLALGHPRWGYYMGKDPLGRGGDFTTAPEISQMFGEMVGAWCADVWMKAGRPSSFLLVECGPGRGTLMADIWRVTANVPGFHETASLHLIETSPALRERQAQSLNAAKPRWHEHIDELPDDRPLLLIANEFFDALPIRQLQKTANGWAERVIGLDDEGALSFGLVPSALPAPPIKAQSGDIVEISPARDEYMNRISRLLRAQGGAALVIDYGHVYSAPGDTLQAVKDHRYADILQDIGQADLTSHVDFEALAKIAAGHELSCHGPVTQGDFLKRLGISMRAAALKAQANDMQVRAIDGALGRLTGTGTNEMGQLFKVLGVCHDSAIKLEGF